MEYFNLTILFETDICKKEFKKLIQWKIKDILKLCILFLSLSVLLLLVITIGSIKASARLFLNVINLHHKPWKTDTPVQVNGQKTDNTAIWKPQSCLCKSAMGPLLRVLWCKIIIMESQSVEQSTLGKTVKCNRSIHVLWKHYLHSWIMFCLVPRVLFDSSTMVYHYCQINKNTMLKTGCQINKNTMPKTGSSRMWLLIQQQNFLLERDHKQ